MGNFGDRHSLHTPRRRWTDFPAGLRRVRMAAGLTQSDLADMLDVDQATISRWERGAQMPDTPTQARLRDLLFRGRAISDARLVHLVRSASCRMYLVDAEAKFVAISEAARDFIGAGRQSLFEVRSPAVGENWKTAVEAGFFRGEVASMHGVAEIQGADGTQRHVSFSLHPATLADDTILMLAEARDIDRASYDQQRPLGLRVVPLEEIL